MKTTTHSQKVKDLQFGNAEEDRLISKIGEHFKIELTKTKPNYEFDYINKEKKMLFELKSRRVSKDQYPSTMVGHNKIIEGQKQIKLGYRVYFIFSFTDWVCSYELKTNSILKIKDGGRSDRGVSEIRKYAYIYIDQLINCFENNKNTLYIPPKMTDQQPKTNTTKPLSFSKRLIEYIGTNPMEIKENDEGTVCPNIQQITWMINNFSMTEYEKRKEKTDEMPFGKYKFKKVAEVAKFDKQYLKWLVKQEMLNSYEDLKAEINKLI
jgi:hypothetical protein